MRTKRKKRVDFSEAQPKTTMKPPREGIKLGKYKARNICLYEAAINNLVLRIPITGVRVRSSPKQVRNSIPQRLILTRSLQPMVRRSAFKNRRKNVFIDTEKTKNGLRKRPIILKRRAPVAKLSKAVKITPTKRFFLQFHPKKYTHSRITVNFEKLTEMLCAMKLPSHLWKVALIMDSNQTTMFSFTSNQPQRSISFSQINPYYRIIVDGAPVILLGCPKTVDTIRDIEILLDIVNGISLKDCMVARV